MTRKFMNENLMESFSSDLFNSKSPFPWFDFDQFLTPEGFQTLYHDFPSLDSFEKHTGMPRVHGQRPHDRYYLAYESSVYGQSNRFGKGVIKHQELPETWQDLIEEIESQEYRSFIQSLLGVQEFDIRYAWHVGVTHSEVSPHVDGPDKIGTHIFYFNTSQDWNEQWGGAILALGRKLADCMNPDFGDFTEALPTQITDNHSFLFKNTPNAWHGVKPLTCPEGCYRRLFNVIFEVPDTRSSDSSQASLLSLVKKLNLKRTRSKLTGKAS
jgi:predicted heme/steroid binding protein